MPNRIKELRKRKNLTQSDLARIVGVSLKTFQNWERGDSEMTLIKALDLADALDVDVKELLKKYSEDTEEKLAVEEPESSLEYQIKLLKSRVKELENLNKHLQEALIKAMDKL